MSNKNVNEVEQSLVERLRIRATIRRQIPTRKSVQEGKEDRLAILLDEAANELEKQKNIIDLSSANETNKNVRYISEILKIIEHGLTCNGVAVSSYALLLSQKLLEDGFTRESQSVKNRALMIDEEKVYPQELEAK